MTRYKHQYPRHTYLDGPEDGPPIIVSLAKLAIMMSLAFFAVYGVCTFILALSGLCPCQ